MFLYLYSHFAAQSVDSALKWQERPESMHGSTLKHTHARSFSPILEFVHYIRFERTRNSRKKRISKFIHVRFGTAQILQLATLGTFACCIRPKTECVRVHSIDRAIDVSVCARKWLHSPRKKKKQY